MSRFTPKLLLLAMLATAGCATEGDFHADNRKAYYSGNTELAVAKIDQAIKEHPEESDFLKLDRAMVMLSDGHPKEAELLLKEVRDRWDEEDTVQERSLGQNQFARISLNGGDDKGYEKVMIRVMLSLCNLMAGGKDAESFAFQANQLQKSIVKITSAKEQFNEPYRTIPVADYICGILHEAKHARFEVAAKSYEQVAKMVPYFTPNPYKQDMERVKNGKHCEEGNGVVYVFVMVGRGPRRNEQLKTVEASDVLVANQMLNKAGKKAISTPMESIKSPAIDYVSNGDFMSCLVEIDGSNVESTKTVNRASNEISVLESGSARNYIAEALFRRETMSTNFEAMKESIGKLRHYIAESPSGDFKFLRETPKIVELSSWDFLPDEFQALRIELPAGVHEVSLTFNQGPLLNFHCPEWSYVFAPEQDKFGPVRLLVEKGQNTYVLANHVGNRFVGKITTNKPLK